MMKTALFTLALILTQAWALGSEPKVPLTVAPNTIAIIAFDGEQVDYAPKTATDQFLKLADGRYVFWCTTPGLKVFASIKLDPVSTEKPECKAVLVLQEVLVTGEGPKPPPPGPDPPVVDVSSLKGLVKNNKIAEFYRDFAKVVTETDLITTNKQFRATYTDAGKAFWMKVGTEGIAPGTGAAIDKVLEKHLGLSPEVYNKQKTREALNAIADYFTP
jgi:hypothetical protein